MSLHSLFSSSPFSLSFPLNNLSLLHQDYSRVGGGGLVAGRKILHPLRGPDWGWEGRALASLV